MKPCVCVVIVLFFYTITRLRICLAFYSKTQKTHINNKATVFYFLFYRFSGAISDVRGQKKIKIKLRIQVFFSGLLNNKKNLIS